MFRPEFIMIPTVLSEDKNIRPTDEKLYGYIYWLTKLKNEQCAASNETLASLIGTTARTVQASLERLEKGGFIKRILEKREDGGTSRKEIIPLIVFGLGVDVQTSVGGDQLNARTRPNGDEGIRSNERHNNNIYINKSIELEEGNSVKKIFDSYQTKIQPGCKWIDSARQKIRTRLGVYSEEELLRAIDLFSKDSWWMENNSTRGATWFFNSDSRIEQFLGIKPRGAEVVKGIYKSKSGLKIPESIKV